MVRIIEEDEVLTCGAALFRAVLCRGLCSTRCVWFILTIYVCITFGHCKSCNILQVRKLTHY